MIKITLLSPGQFHRAKWWLLAAAAFALLVILLASKITQLALPGLNVQPKTVVLDPKCPTPEQKEVIERNLNLYGAGLPKVTTTRVMPITWWQWPVPWAIQTQSSTR